MPTEFTIVNEYLPMILRGTDLNKQTKDVLIRPDRSLSVWSQMVGRNSKGQRIVELDPSDILRMRLYEPLFPITSILMPGALTAAYTSTGVRSTVRIDMVNTIGDPTATCHVVRDVDGVTGDFDITNSATPVPDGVGIRLGHFDLDAGGTISGSSNPANSCTLTVTVERYSSAGDTP
jgi:hypothetical protein